LGCRLISAHRLLASSNKTVADELFGQPGARTQLAGSQSIQLNPRVEIETDGKRNFHAQYVIILMDFRNELMCANHCLAGPAWRLIGRRNECYRAAASSGISTVRLFTACADGCRVLTVNADNQQEAKDALTMLGVTGDGSLIIRRATPDEAACWCASAIEAGTL
jgi:hypothetical protein